MFTSRYWVTTGLVLLGCSISTAASASATTFIVNTTVDAVDHATTDGVCLIAGGGCSLRAAIQQANASDGADTIVLPAGTYNLSVLGRGDDESLSGDLDIVRGSEITIVGDGAGTTIIDGLTEDRVMQVHTDGILTVNGVTIRDGTADQASSGGGIDNHEGTLTVNDCIFDDNIVFGMGGAINNFRGTLEINRSLFSGNLALNTGGAIMNQDGDVTINYTTIRDNFLTDSQIPTFGGGIYNSALFNTLEINNSTISGNRAFLDGGGIYHLIGTLRITNTTISNNRAVRYGGGLMHSSGNSTFGVAEGGNKLVNVTVSGNYASGYDDSDPTPSAGGGGIFVRGAVPLRLANSIVADNVAGGDCSNDGELISLGHNVDGDGTCELGSDATSFANGSAGLDVLADNGGPTLTYALLAGSDALDTGDDTQCPATDQRGYERPVSGCDIGAFESEGIAPVEPLSAPSVATTETAENNAPQATGALLTVDAGGEVSSTFEATDADDDPLTFEIVDQPQLGTVGQDAGGSSGFTYAPRADAAGSDSFTFRVCDSSDACSAAAVINVSITNQPVNSDVIIQVAPGSGSIVGEKQITLPDVDYTQPLGVFRFDIEDVPTDPDANINGTEVTISLPTNAEISPDAVIRKLNIYQVWETLGSDPDPQVSTGTIDHVTKTITLILRDNDRFDLNRDLGVIADPVALAVRGGADVTPDTSTDSGPNITASNSSSGEASIVGGGVLHPLLLVMMGLAGWLLRRP